MIDNIKSHNQIFDNIRSMIITSRINGDIFSNVLDGINYKTLLESGLIKFIDVVK